MANETKRDWETFKTLVAQYICMVVLPNDAYNWQVQYMLERFKPLSLTSKQWWLRIETDKISTGLVECEHVKAKIGKALRADGSPRMWKKLPPTRGQKGFLS